MTISSVRATPSVSVKQLGIRIGIDPASASARMNRYELGKRVPDLDLIERLAAELDLPAAFFYAEGDDEAELLVKFHRLKGRERETALTFVSELSDLRK